MNYLYGRPFIDACHVAGFGSQYEAACAFGVSQRRFKLICGMEAPATPEMLDLLEQRGVDVKPYRPTEEDLTPPPAPVESPLPPFEPCPERLPAEHASNRLLGLTGRTFWGICQEVGITSREKAAEEFDETLETIDAIRANHIYASTKIVILLHQKARSYALRGSDLMDILPEIPEGALIRVGPYNWRTKLEAAELDPDAYLDEEDEEKTASANRRRRRRKSKLTNWAINQKSSKANKESNR